MSGRVNSHGDVVALAARPVETRRLWAVSRYKGVGMLEFLIALLIFSTGMLGLLSGQLAGKRANYEAAQRSVATAVARDILERMRANPRHILSYRITAAGNADNRLPLPGLDCDTAACSAAQLAVFDLWQWESLLLGESEMTAGGAAGGLLSPRACITSDGGVVAVAISWLGVAAAGQASVSVCGSDAESTTRQRSQLKFSTFIGGR